MDENRREQTPAFGAAPPTQPGALEIPTQTSNWALPVGVIAIVFGSLGALGGLSGLFSLLMRDTLASMASTGQQTNMNVVDEWRWWTTPSSLVTLALAAMLLAAGIGCTKRRRWSRPACMTWAVLKMLFVVVSAVISHIIQQRFMEELSQQNSAGSGIATSMALATRVGSIFAVAWGWALPVFMLIWFSRSQIKAEVAAWR